MTEKAQTRLIALFYFLGLLDDSKAKHATIKAVRKCRKRLRMSSVIEKDIPSVLVHYTNAHWEKAKNISSLPNSNSYEVGWVIPSDLDLGSWRAFQNEAAEEEFLAVLWSRVLQISDEQIARGLGVTEGTVRYRVGRGLRLLGALLSPQES